MTPHVSILVLNWNGAGDTIACVRSLAGLTFENREVVVIDNGSTDDSADTIRASLPGVTLVRNPRNLGFAAGNNVGVRRALARGSDYVWLLNSDTVVEPASLDALVALAESDPRVGIVGSVLRSADGSETVEAWGGGVLHPRLAHAVRRTRPFTASWPWVSGASMLIRAELLASVGLLDERYFFFIEDVDLCYRAVRAGWRVDVAEVLGGPAPGRRRGESRRDGALTPGRQALRPLDGDLSGRPRPPRDARCRCASPRRDGRAAPAKTPARPCGARLLRASSPGCGWEGGIPPAREMDLLFRWRSLYLARLR